MSALSWAPEHPSAPASPIDGASIQPLPAVLLALKGVDIDLWHIRVAIDDAAPRTLPEHTHRARGELTTRPREAVPRQLWAMAGGVGLTHAPPRLWACGGVWVGWEAGRT